ncbi:hypothetical protein ACN9ML_11865 [Dyadobacter endophyticus]|uniref:hypothetical protein n=1 Tax=Dyadobacter endophyticus TaxID=1749036 RepID=UPI003CEB92F3
MFEIFYRPTFEGGPDNWIKDYLIPFLAAITPVCIVFWQQAAEKAKAKQAEIQENDERLKYLSVLVHGALQFTDRIILQIDEIVESLRKAELYTELIEISDSSDITRITDRIDQAVYFSSYIKKFPSGHLDISTIFIEFDKINATNLRFSGITMPSQTEQDITIPRVRSTLTKVLGQLTLLNLGNNVPNEAKETTALFINEIDRFEKHWIVDENDCTIFERVFQFAKQQKVEGRQALNELYTLSERGKTELAEWNIIADVACEQTLALKKRLEESIEKIRNHYADLHVFYNPFNEAENIQP